MLLAFGVGLAGRVRLLTPLLGIVAYLELVRLGQSLYRFGSPADLFPPTPLLEALARQPSVPCARRGRLSVPELQRLPALQEIRTHDPVERRDYVDYLDQIAGYDRRNYFKLTQNVDAPGLDRLNLKYLVSPPDRRAPSEKWRLVYSGTDGRVFENTHAWAKGVHPGAGQRKPGHRKPFGDRLPRDRQPDFSFTAQVPGVTPVLAETSIVSDRGAGTRARPRDFRTRRKDRRPILVDPSSGRDAPCKS